MDDVFVKRCKLVEEDFPDGALLAKLVIPSSPATKKNSSQIIRAKGRNILLPSKRFLDYQKYCKPFMEPLRKELGLPPYDFGISIKIRVATSKWIVPDYNNICQALGDILQHYSVISDDKWIHWTDGETINNVPVEHWFIGVDAENPRLEIEIRRFRHKLETYRENKEALDEKKFLRKKSKQNIV